MSRGLALHDIRFIDQLQDMGRALEDVEIDIASKFGGRDADSLRVKNVSNVTNQGIWRETAKREI